MAENTEQEDTMVLGKPLDTDEKNKGFFISYARYIQNFYNPVLPTNLDFGVTIVNSTKAPLRWVQRYVETWAYIQGIQNDLAIAYMANDESNNPLPSIINEENTLYELYKHLMGSMVKKNMTLSDTIFAKNITSEALEDKNLFLNIRKAKMEMQQIMNQIQIDKAKNQSPQADIAIKAETQDQMDKFSVETVQDVASTYFTNYAKDWLWKTGWEKWTKLAFSYLLPAWFVRAELYTEKGQVKVKIHRPANCIFDTSEDDEFGEREKFQAVLCQYSVPELFQKYPRMYNDVGIRDEVNTIAKGSTADGSTMNMSYLNTYLNTTGLLWWQMIRGVPTISVLECAFESTDENGKLCWYECDFIGNKWLENQGKTKNQRFDNQGKPLPKYIDFIPDMQNGYNRSDFHRMIGLANQIKAIEFKIGLLIVRAKGKIPVFVTSKLAQGQDVQSLLQDIATGLVVLEGVDIDMLNAAGKDPKFAILLDFAADAQAIQAFRAEIEVKKNQMRSIASVPLMTLGLQNEGTGKGVQDRTIEQATFGTIPVTYGFTQWVNNVIGGACQIRKGLIYLQKEQSVEESLQVSKDEFGVFEVSKDFTNAQLQIYIDDTDVINETLIARLDAIFERESQLPGTYLDSAVYAEALTKKTVTQLVNFLNYEKKKFTRKQEEIAAAAAQAEKANKISQEITSENLADKQVHGALANKALQHESDLELQGNEHAQQQNMQPAQ